MNILLDVLANNTHLNAYMANMSANEMFIDSGEIRQSVVSKAKELGYLPRSVRASQATMNVTLNNVQDEIPEGGGAPEPPAFVIMDAGTQFTNENGIIFSTADSYLLYPTGTIGQYSVDDVDIYDGRYIEFDYTVDVGQPDQKFRVPSVDADMSTLRVVIRPTEGSSEELVYTLNDDINYLTPDSLVYFLHETSEGHYEVTFGDGNLGKAIEHENFVSLTYIVAQEKGSANGIEEFSPYQRINGQGSNDIVLETTIKSFNGSEKEDIESIRFLALRFFQSQKRAVTTQDYEAFLIRDYPFIESINTWSGEYNDPPTYGKIFIAIKPYHTEFLSTTLKEQIKDDLIRKYNVVTVIPEMVDPDYLYVLVDSDVYYTRSRTTLAESALVNLVTDSIYNYFLNTTRKFKMSFQFSPLTAEIDGSDQSIDNSLTGIRMSKRAFPIVGLVQTFTMKFNNALLPNTIESSLINTESNDVPGESIKTGIKDDGNGVIYSYNAITGVVIESAIGAVDYETGTMSFTLLSYSLPPDTLDIRVYATPKLKNIVPGNNQIIAPDTSAANGEYNRHQGIDVDMVVTNTEVA